MIRRGLSGDGAQGREKEGGARPERAIDEDVCDRECVDGVGQLKTYVKELIRKIGGGVSLCGLWETRERADNGRSGEWRDGMSEWLMRSPTIPLSCGCTSSACCYLRTLLT